MAFKFNFLQLEEQQEPNNTSASSPTRAELAKSEPILEIALQDVHEKAAQKHLSAKTFLVLSCDIKDSYELYYIPASAVDTEHIQTSDFENAISKAYGLDSDLIPGEYEGGLKLWECAIDLLGFLNEKNFDFKNRSVLELGCGAGIPGIFCLLNGASVHFQDYNKDVIDLITIPNVIMNAEKHDMKCSEKMCRFYAADWRRFADKFLNAPESDRFDYILTSETIYNPESYDALYSIFKSSLKTTGKIYVAAKSCYFGIGGSTQQFRTFIEDKKKFSITTCKVYEEGIRREILALELPA